jgi:hypothetical protein
MFEDQGLTSIEHESDWFNTFNYLFPCLPDHTGSSKAQVTKFDLRLQYPYPLITSVGMSVNRSHHVLHRMVPLICQALTSSNDETVWLDGLRLLASPKLKTALSITASIWLPLLLKGLDVSRSSAVNTAGLILLSEVADQLKPMKSCLAKPLKALSRDAKIGNSQELVMVLLRLDMEVSPGLGPKGSEGRERRAARSIGVSLILLLPTRSVGPLSPRFPCSDLIIHHTIPYIPYINWILGLSMAIQGRTAMAWLLLPKNPNHYRYP